jgi:UPF0716 family protein affecting phage T7 exclusion
VIPGFITDLLGLLILLPLTRLFIIGLIFSYLGPVNNNPMKNRTNEDWIEGEYKKDK